MTSAYLTINHVTKSYGFHLILSDVSFVVNAGERIGLVGANGVGKSTLLKIVNGEIVPDAGETLIAPDHKLGYLAQIIEGFDDQTLDDLIAASVADLRDLEARMRALEHHMTTASGDDLAAVMDEYGEVRRPLRALRRLRNRLSGRSGTDRLGRRRDPARPPVRDAQRRGEGAHRFGAAALAVARRAAARRADQSPRLRHHALAGGLLAAAIAARSSSSRTTASS